MEKRRPEKCFFSGKVSSFLLVSVVCCGQEEQKKEAGGWEEKEAGASTKETGDLILRLAGHKDKKLYLTEGEHKKAVQALNGLRDTYIENGRYTDGIDTVLMRIMNARYRTYRTR